MLPAVDDWASFIKSLSMASDISPALVDRYINYLDLKSSEELEFIVSCLAYYKAQIALARAEKINEGRR